MSQSDDLWERLRKAPPEPRESCPIINAAQRDIKGAVRDADRARRAIQGTDAEPASDALEAASTALSELESPLEECRTINGALRDRCSRIEKIAEDAIEALGEEEEKALERETQLTTAAAVIKGLGEQIQAAGIGAFYRPWWRRLIDHAAATLWRRRARATAQRNSDLRWALIAAQEREIRHTGTLTRVAAFLGDMEWESIGPGRKRCPECMTEWNTWNPFAPAPAHDLGCGIGEIVAEVEDTLAERPRIYRAGEEGA